MGMIKMLLTWPVSLPLSGVGWLSGKIAAQAESEMYDPAKIKEAMQALEDALEDGAISEDEFDEAERVLLDRLKEAASRAAGQSSGQEPEQGDVSDAA